jgi:DNA topoisomerase-1
MDPVPMPELACVNVEDHYVLRDGAAGLFLAASQFPKHRETRAPLVSEILPHREEIDPKYSFLFEAPTEDPDGNPAQIRFSRKTKEQYVMSEVDGKPTGWKATYESGRWIEEKAAPKAKTKAKAKAKASARKKPASARKAAAKRKAGPDA